MVQYRDRKHFVTASSGLTPEGSTTKAKALLFATAAILTVAGATGTSTASAAYKALVTRTVRQSPSQINAALQETSQLLASAKNGAALRLPGVRRSRALQIAELNATQLTLTSAQRSGVLPAAADGAVRETVRPGTAQIAASGPSSFALRGAAINSKRTWQGPWELAADFCTSTCSLKDDVRVRLNVDPAPGTTRFSFNATYSPNSGSYSDIHMQGFALCGGSSSCAQEDFPPGGPRNGVGLGTAYLSNPSQANGRLAHGIILWGHFSHDNAYHGDTGKTGTATCGASTCHY